MRAGYQSLGWWVRRPPGVAAYALDEYYTQVVGLPLLRQGGSASLFWAGEDLVYEIMGDDDPAPADTTHDGAQLLPIFRSHDLVATVRRFEAAGYPIEAEEICAYATTVWIRGADRLLLGFEERRDDSPFDADVEALRRWRTGTATRLDGVASLAPELQYLSRIRRRVEDPAAVGAFYRDVLGFDVVGTDAGAQVFSLGDTVLLEVLPGGTARALPTDRNQLHDTFVSRIHGFVPYVEALTAAGVDWVGEQFHFDIGAKLAYFADPEGMVIGVQSRTLEGNYAEDLEAERRWAKVSA